MSAVTEERRNILGISGFVVAMVGVTSSVFPMLVVRGSPTLSVVGIVLSAIGRSRAKRDPRVPHGGLALAGVIIGIAGLLVAACVLAILVALSRLGSS
jgi:hypothetical protein